MTLSPKVNLPHVHSLMWCNFVTFPLNLQGTKPSFSAGWGEVFFACVGHRRNATTPKKNGLVSTCSTLVLVAFFPAAYRCKKTLSVRREWNTKSRRYGQIMFKIPFLCPVCGVRNLGGMNPTAVEQTRKIGHLITCLVRGSLSCH